MNKSVNRKLSGQDTNVARPPQDTDLPLPHERDEAPATPPQAGETGRPRQVIEQAARDIRRGLRDTDRRGVPSDVPGPGVAPERSPGAEVPDEGVDVAGPGGGAAGGKDNQP